MSIPSDLLKFTNARSGKLVKDNFEAWNEADWGFLQDLASPFGAVLRKRGFFWVDLKLNLASEETYYYSFEFSQVKHTLVFARPFAAGEGPIKLEIMSGATFTPGTASPIMNSYIGEAGPDLVITKGATNVVGGLVTFIDYLFSAGNLTSVAGSINLPTVFNPSDSMLLKITNKGTGTNPGIKVGLEFTEVEIPEGLV